MLSVPGSSLLVRLAVPAVVVAMFFGPLVASGELAVWAFEEPVSHLVWDEGMVGPGETGSVAPGSGAALDGPWPSAVSFVLLPAVLGGAVWSWARVMRPPCAPVQGPLRGGDRR